jgi:hypothetical protein
MTKTMTSWLAGALLAAAAVNAGAASELLARIEYAAVLPGSGHSWGFAALDPARPYLWIARRDNGLTVFDVDKRRAVRTLDDSKGANAVAFVPAADRAYVANTDGSLGVVRLSDLRMLKRLPVSDANLNSVVLEPASGKVFISSGRRAERSTIYVLDPKSDRLVAQQDFAIRKIDPPLAPGDGTLFVPMRDEGKVMRLDAATLAVRSTWSWPACKQPSALAADPGRRRLFVACRGEQPVLVVADLERGTQVASAPVGHAVNALAYDASRRLLLAPSGADASLTLLRQDDADHYTPLGQVATRSWAHNMSYDGRSGAAYLLSMDVTQPATPAGGARPDPVFHPDTFSVLRVKVE